jgi:hypothetical protein
MEKLISEQIVDSILSQDKEAFVDAFNAAIAAKVSDALEVKKVEIASSLITPEMAVEEEVEQVEEGAKEWKQAFKKVSSKNLNKDVAAVRSSVYRLDKATKSDDEDDEEVKDKVRKGMSEEAEQIDELKKSTLKSYVKKANREMKKAYDYHQMGQGGRDGTDQNYLKNAYPKALAKYDRRDAGVEKAKQKLAKSDKK